ncbi:MAG: hypothetical protein KUG76_05860 [Gammaproteobacteria bacterium]|nr:hypothetical protein [Gammaproteobacteria bacterium]
MESSNIETAVKILKSWHTVEFFQPYSVPDDSDKSVKITSHELQSQKDAMLPWLDPRANYHLKIPQGKKIRYTLYLGVFDKGELNRVVENKLGGAQDDLQYEEWDQRTDKEGDTCYAKLELDHFGTPDFTGMSVSTLPWALGHLVNDSVRKLSHKAFEQQCTLLEEMLERLSLILPNNPEKPELKTLNSGAIVYLLNELAKWAGYVPSNNVFCFSLGWREVKSNKGKKKLEGPASKNAQERECSLATVSDTGINETTEEGVSTVEYSMPILNSFYLQDIERAINGLQRGEDLGPLMTYLSSDINRHADLYTQDGLKLIIERLSPKLTPAGRWPSNPAHNMSLMQQLAVNVADDELSNGGLLSVNGPPGTGKTTMLRDIVARNAVERAKVLASFQIVDDGLTDNGLPIESLLGFDMVVASSNNAAVENISKELPLKKSVADDFEGLAYFVPVANHMAAKEVKGDLLALSDSEFSWGLVSAISGSVKNRRKLAERVMGKGYYKKNSAEENARLDGKDFLSYWGFFRAEKSKLPSFNECKSDFENVLKAYKNIETKLDKYAQLHCEINGISRNEFIQKEAEKLKEVQSVIRELEHEFTRLGADLDVYHENVDIESLKLSQLEAFKPVWWRRFLNLFKDKTNSPEAIQIRAVRDELIKYKQLRADVKKQHAISSAKLLTQQETAREASRLLARREEEFTWKTNKLTQYSAEFPDTAIPEGNDQIDSPALQRNALWQNLIINRVRSDLFVAAMHLHQSWLLEASSGGGAKAIAFRENSLFRISDLLSGKKVDFPKQVWGTLFLIVPVLSTTFASFKNQFKSLDIGDIGWLLIDEAGQAAPQAAVGALWRAKRALVVGDPLQIEPVCTTPPKLVEYLSQTVLGDCHKEWAPHLMSVQLLSDRVNPYGCELKVGEKTQWIGLPLWVHRRCIDPMFSVSNTIAYDNRMVHGNKSYGAESHSVFGPNNWIDVKGDCVRKQFVPEQAEVLYELLHQKLSAGEGLNDVYVISPFKAVKEELKNRFKQPPTNRNWSFRQHNEWLKDNIGTVHTFQGKENSIVIIVLGCSADNQGGAVWASDLPNLLNVAITRAKSNLYVIGDVDVWGGRKYFRDLKQALPVRECQQEMTTQV